MSVLFLCDGGSIWSFINLKLRKIYKWKGHPFFSDLSSGTYISQLHSSCSNLCQSKISYGRHPYSSRLYGDHQWTLAASGSRSCCDAKAKCSCGTHTGHFACICPPGHYGRGLVGDCKREYGLNYLILVVLQYNSISNDSMSERNFQTEFWSWRQAVVPAVSSGSSDVSHSQFVNPRLPMQTRIQVGKWKVLLKCHSKNNSLLQIWP